MNELDQGYKFNPADLVEYAMDKPIGINGGLGKG